jgi:tagaturonate reductase
MPAPASASVPATVLQVGEGRFLRAFLGSLVQEARARGAFRARLVLTAPRPSGSARLAELRARGGRYRVVVRGPDGESSAEIAPYARILDSFLEKADLLGEIVAAVPLVIVSNTTEAGLAYRRDDPAHPETFPARLTAWLDLRRRAGIAEPVAVVPCELVADNGRVLEQAVRRHAADWGLPADELLRAVAFAETLVDRIVTSEDPADPLACFTEPYMAFYIGGAPGWVRQVLGLDERFVHWVPDVTPARERKVRLLNGTHTLMAVIGLQMGVETVRGALEHPELGALLRAAMFGDGVGSFPAGERPAARAFAAETLDRFLNPGIRDTLARLALQVTAKVRARWTPIIEGCRRESGRHPEAFALGIAAYLGLAAAPPGTAPVDLAEMDDAAWIGRLRALRAQGDTARFVAAAAGDPSWPAPTDPDLLGRVAAHLDGIERSGMAARVKAVARG